ALGHVDMDVLALEQRRLDAEIRGPRLDIAFRGLNGFAHHLAQLAGDDDLALARQGDGFDRQDLAADFGPGETGGDAHQVLLLRFAVAITAHAGILLEVARRDGDALQALDQDVLDRLA